MKVKPHPTLRMFRQPTSIGVTSGVIYSATRGRKSNNPPLSTGTVILMIIVAILVFCGASFKFCLYVAVIGTVIVTLASFISLPNWNIRQDGFGLKCLDVNVSIENSRQVEQLS